MMRREADLPIETQVCSRCRVEKSLDAFSLRYEYNPPRRRGVCKKCRSDAWKDSPARKDARRRHNLKYKYGITVEEYDALLAIQGGVCAICKQSPDYGRRLAVDHEHSSGRVRGLLCSACNRGVGYLQDDPVLCRVASEYLEHNG